MLVDFRSTHCLQDRFHIMSAVVFTLSSAMSYRVVNDVMLEKTSGTVPDSRLSLRPLNTPDESMVLGVYGATWL